MVRHFARTYFFVSDPIAGVCGVAAGVLIGLGSVNSGLAKTILLIVGITLFVASAVMIFVNEKRRLKLRKLEASRRYQLLDKDLSPLLQLLAEAIGTKDTAKRSEYAARVRQGVVIAASVIVAPNVKTGTRANLFRRDGDEMRLEPGCFSGRGDKSKRVFKKTHETTKQAMKNQFRFVKDVDDPALKYGTYLTYPVASADDRILGVLTVDCLTSGDLSEDDLPAMCVLAAIAAAAYECETPLNLAHRNGDAAKLGASPEESKGTQK